MSTLQDSQGFVWLGTEDGLVRYDGHELLPLRLLAHARRGGLPGNFIYADRRGRAPRSVDRDQGRRASRAGTARTDTLHASIATIRPTRTPSRATRVRAVLVDARGRVWIGTCDAGVDILDPASGRIEHLRHDPQRSGLAQRRPHLHPGARSRRACCGSAPRPGSSAGSPSTRAFMPFSSRGRGDPHSLSGDQISRVLEDQSGALWVGTFDAGLDRMDRDGRVLRGVPSRRRRSTTSLAQRRRAGAARGSGGAPVGRHRRTGWSCWTAPPGSSATTGTTRAMRTRCATRSSCRCTRMPPACVWIGTRAGGVSRWNPRSWELGGHRPEWLGDKLGHRIRRRAQQQGLDRLARRRTRPLYDAATGMATDIDAIVGRAQRARRSARDVAAPGSPRHAVDRHDESGLRSCSPGRTARVDSA